MQKSNTSIENKRKRWLLYSLAFVGISFAIIAALLYGPTREATTIAARDTIVSVQTFTLPGLPDSLRFFEPSIAVDPERPERVLVGVTRQRQSPWKSIAVGLFSDDGGKTWGSPEQIHELGYPGFNAGGGDPVVAAGPNGEFYFTALTKYSGTSPDGRNLARDGVVVASTGRKDYHLRNFAEAILYEIERPSRSSGSNSPPPTAAAKSFSTLARPQIVQKERRSADKEWLAVDRSNGPRRGTLYVAWDDISQSGTQLLVAASSDGGRTFRPPVPIHTSLQKGTHFNQIVVGPDGKLHAVWIDYMRRAVVHAISDDGGKTFSGPVIVRAVPALQTPAGEVFLDAPSLAVSPRGALLACGVDFPSFDYPKSEAELKQFKVPRERAWCASAPDGRRWQSPISILSTNSEADRLALPAAGATKNSLWMLGYRLDDKAMRVVLYQSVDGGKTWKEAAELARRGFGSDGLRTCVGSAPADLGDYMGLTAASDRLYAAFVLPATDDPASTPSLYVSAIKLK